MATLIPLFLEHAPQKSYLKSGFSVSVRSLKAFECPIFSGPDTPAASPLTGAASEDSEARLLFL